MSDKPYSRLPRATLHLDDYDEVNVFSDDITWPYPQHYPQPGATILLGERCWSVTVKRVEWLMDPADPIIAIHATVDGGQRRDHDFICRMLEESGML